MLKLKKLNQLGIGLIETLLAISISIIVVTAMVSLSLFTLRASLQNKLLLSGTQFASQELELVRAYRDSRAWTDFIDDIDGTTDPLTNCLIGDCHMESGVGTIAVADDTDTTGSGTEAITRGFRVTDVNGDQTLMRISVTVSWQIGTETKFAHNYTELSNWRGQ